ncbi:MAG: response regulator [Inquilinus sp.]|nr:response regulator [Inquilinus sp.]
MPDPVVFVVDDDAAVRDSLKFVLSAADYRVETFASGEEFLERWRHDRAGCLLADMNLPDMSGANLAGMLKGRVANLSIILMTGKGGRRSRAMADRLGAFYIEKPFIHDCLLATVRGAMASHADGSASATTHDG